MTHLGDRAAAFVDGQLSPESAERTTAHLATCRPCRDLVELERLTKARLSALCGPEPAADLVGRLLAMGGPAGPLPPRSGYVPGSPRPQPVTMPAPHRGGVQVLRRSARPEQSEGIRPAQRTDRRELTERIEWTAPQRDVPRPGQRREPATSTRPSGRPHTTVARPSRLAVAVLGALSVVGVGVAGVAVGSTAAASGATTVPQRPGTVVEPASAGFVTVRLAPIEWTQGVVSSRIPVERTVARR